ncbi:hypothetical protein SAMN05444280_11182 [Tangfeifania diversioriginum]|uniref:Acetyltransferase (GNAT) domain-containing protein n=1 Tax=Tangfeifania diversioriginum TaxID=1168035 RepID=A0A1M6GQK8_9BACT|nr:hypothetical protein [Tangfeifania diversioriginum]SHJ12277.1 hypothetical protein SAMN05444280_11182 [Tangfeifania diversioriginum]
MEIFEVTHEKFGNIISNPFYIYGNADFNYLNKHKCESLHYLLFKENKYRLGIVGGVRGGAFLSAFSAPFGGFIHLRGDIKISYLENAIDLLVKWGKSKNLKAINLILPPPVYDENFISKQINCLFHKDFYILKIELNHIFFTRKFDDNYKNNLWRNGRNNLNKALKKHLNFHLCENLLEKRIAYQVIKLNKQTKQLPLTMSWEEILMYTAIINTDFFIAYNAKNFPIGAAIVFHVSQSVVQVAYWGDNLKYSHLRTMNYLAHKIFEYYHDDFKIIDLGPSSENCTPNVGLCNFKESIGCDTTTKFSFIRSLT